MDTWQVLGLGAWAVLCGAVAYRACRSLVRALADYVVRAEQRRVKADIVLADAIGDLRRGAPRPTATVTSLRRPPTDGGLQ